MIREFNYLCGPVEAVILVDDDRVLHVIQDDVFKDDVRSMKLPVSWVGLDSEAICGVRQRGVPHMHADHVLFARILAEAADTGSESMSF